MSEKPTYDQLEKRVAELEQQVDLYKSSGIQNPPDLLSALMEAFNYIPLCKTFEDAARKIFDQCKRLTGASSGYVALLSENGDENEVLFLDAGGLPCDVDPSLPMPIRGLREIAYKTKDVAFDNTFSKSPWMEFIPEGHVRLDNVLFAPLIIEEKTVGVIGIANKPGGFNEQDVHISKILGELAAVALTYARTQDSLKESETKYRHLVSNLPGTAYQFVLTTKGDFRFEYIGENCIELFGISAKDIIADANQIFDLIPQPDADQVNKAIMDSAASLEPYNIEHRVIKKNGETVWILASSIPRKLENGSTIWDGIGLDITRKKQTEQALRESHGNLMSLIDNTDDIVVSRNLEGRALVYNRSFKQIVKTLFGFEARPGIRTLDYLPEESKKHWEKTLCDVVKSGIRRREEFTWEIDGKAHYYEISHSPIWVNGKTIGTTEYTRDITERKETENALRKSEQRLSLALEAVSDAIWDWRIDTGEVYFNSGWYKLLGFEPYELPQDYSTWTDLLHPEDRKNAENTISRHLEKNEPFNIEFRMRTKGGQWKWLLGRGKTVERDANGNAARMIGTNVNISERKHLEKELLQAKAELQRTLEATTDGIWTWDFVTNKLSFTPKYYTMLGYEPNEFPATYESWLNLIHPDDIEKAIAEASTYLKTKPDVYLSEFRLKTKNGGYRWIRSHARVVDRDKQGNALFMIGNHEDITERKKNENDLKSLVHDQAVILDNVPAYIYFKDTENNILRISQSVADITGLPKEKIEGRHSSEIYPEMAELYWADDLKVIASKKQKRGIVEPLPVGNGETRWLMTDKIPVFGEDSEVIGVVVMASDITDRVTAENQLKESEKRFRTLIESGPMAIFMLRDGRYIYGNPAAARMLGYEMPQDIVGVSALQTVALEFQEIIKKRIKKIDEGKSNEPLELKFVKRNGDVIWTLSTSVSVTMEGKPTAIIMGQDITELRKAKQALNNAQTMQIAFAEHLPAGMMQVDAATRKIESVNAYAASLFGAGMDEIVGHTCHTFICPASEGECPVCDLGQKIDNTEREIVLKDGKRLPVLKSVVSVTIDEKEKLFEYFVDISDRKKVELDLKESEKKYRKLLETAPYGIQLTDREGKILFSNPAHHRIQGYDDGGLIGKYIWELMAKADLRSKAKDYYQKIIREQPQPEVYYNRDLTRDGREIDVQVNWDYIRNTKGELEGIISIISDITKQKALESSVRQAQKMESIGSLAGGIAHDFNNILFPIVGLSEMMLDDFPPGSLEQQNLTEIFQAGKRGRELVQQILSFSRQSEHRPIPVHIQKILKEVLKLCRATIPADIPITQDIKTDCGPVMADPTQIHQIVMNLITNAYHAVEPVGGTISIQLTEVDVTSIDDPAGDLAPGRYTMLSVSDTGIGIDGAFINKIFDPYFTTKEKGRGTGLGLATVYGIVKAHGGDIRVTSDIGKGTTFHVYLPLLEKAQDSEPEKEMTPLLTGTGHILLVDDEKSIVHLEKQMLERLGYQTSSFTSSKDALDAFKTEPSKFDLVITDMNMPNMNGMQLATELIAVRADIPIILCTGFSERISSNKAEALGIRGLLMKPVGMKDLSQKVREVLDTTRE